MFVAVLLKSYSTDFDETLEYYSLYTILKHKLVFIAGKTF